MFETKYITYVDAIMKISKVNIFVFMSESSKVREISSKNSFWYLLFINFLFNSYNVEVIREHMSNESIYN